MDVKGARPPRSTWLAFCDRHFAALAIAVLALAAFNLIYRIGAEVITEWEEAVYAQTAWEMLKSGNWLVTTFYGVVDYYNVKPPLQTWLLAATFKTFGVSLLSLRLVSIVSAWLTVLVLMLWTRRAIGAAVALVAGVVLSSSFGFLQIHSGRSGNADALLTLLILLVVVTLWAAQQRPGRLLWLAPALAAVFLLKGPAVLLPLAIVAIALSLRGRHDLRRWITLAAALLLAFVPIAAWAIERWRFDEFQFLSRVLGFDFLARSVRPLDEHGGTPLFYLNILQKHHYEWLLAAIVAWLMLPAPRRLARRLVDASRSVDQTTAIALGWAGVTLLVPTFMATKLPWYLNPFYPVFALGVGWIVVSAFDSAQARSFDFAQAAPGTSRRVMLGAVIVLALLVAEGKLIWYSYQYRDLAASEQGLLLDSRDDVAGREVFQPKWTRADRFVLEAMIGGHSRTTTGPQEFVDEGCPGNIYISSEPLNSPRLELVRSNDRFWLYRRR